jgi:type I restriction enzyme S subunit
MSFPRYPKYKESGVEWLGRVPEHWKVKPLWSLFRFSKGLTITKEDLRDEGVPCVNYGEIHSKYGVSLDPDKHPLKCVDQSWVEKQADALISKGDFVYADTSEDQEGSGNFTCLANGGPIFAGYHTIIARPRSGLSSSFFAHEFDSQAFRNQIQQRVKGIKVFSITQGLLKGICCWQPPIAEQTAIADFLDQETVKIDELIAEQERLIELLKEKRQAVISHAVTKGLNPDAPMKDSGIEWLGQVPEHWGIERGRSLFKKLEILPEPDDGVVTAFRDGQVTLRKNRRTEGFTIAVLEVGYQRVRSGDLVIHGMDAFAGAIGVSEATGKCTPEYSVMAPQHSGVDNHYYALILRLMAQRNYIFVICPSVRERAPRFRFEAFKDVHLPVPTIREQQEIVRFINDHDHGSKQLIQSVEEGISLLKERRSALISATVTGQIDVRGIHHEQAA